MDQMINLIFLYTQITHIQIIQQNSKLNIPVCSSVFDTLIKWLMCACNLVFGNGYLQIFKTDTDTHNVLLCY